MATRWASARPSRTVLDGPSIGTSMGNWSMGLDELSHRARNTRDLAHSLQFLFYLENYSDFSQEFCESVLHANHWIMLSTDSFP